MKPNNCWKYQARKHKRSGIDWQFAIGIACFALAALLIII